jgi:hypothetical protein
VALGAGGADRAAGGLSSSDRKSEHAKRPGDIFWPMIYLIYRLEGDKRLFAAAAFELSATWRGYTAARRRRPNAASDERAAMRTEDEDGSRTVTALERFAPNGVPRRACGQVRL